MKEFSRSIPSTAEADAELMAELLSVKPSQDYLDFMSSLEQGAHLVSLCPKDLKRCEVGPYIAEVRQMVEAMSNGSYKNITHQSL